MPTNDQTRVNEAVLPLVLRAINADAELTPDVAADATILSRAFAQGADPLFIMEMMGSSFDILCDTFDANPPEVRSLIKQAHSMGPGVFVQNGAGFNPQGWSRNGGVGDCEIALENAPEVIWLLLASCSRLTEEPFAEDVSMAERLRQAMGCFHQAMLMTVGGDDHYQENLEDLVGTAHRTLQTFKENTTFTNLVLDNGTVVPLATVDEGFYIGYKDGLDAVAVQAGNLTFFGTPPRTTLAEQGIEVQKELSPHFGIRFAPEAE